MLRPDPPHDPQWLDLATTTAGGPAARIILPAAAGETRPPAADVTVSQTAPNPGEHLLSTIAARLLAAVPPLPARPLAVRDRATAQGAPQHHRRAR